MTGPLPLDVIGGQLRRWSAPAVGAAASYGQGQTARGGGTDNAGYDSMATAPGGMGGASFGATSAPILRK